jgi:aminopeptidase N
MVPYLNTAKQLQIIYRLKRVKMKLVLNTQQPKQALYFVGSEAADDLQIWTQDKEIPAIGFRVLMM